MMQYEELRMTKPPKSYEEKTITIEFHGNLDVAARKMLWNPHQELDELELLQLKACFLFLCGVPYSKMVPVLGRSKAVISKYLNRAEFVPSLSKEYQILFLKNKYRLAPEPVAKKMKRAVQAFIQMDGDYQETVKQTGFSERTLSRYFADSKLEQYLNDSFLYEQFLKVRKQHTTEIKQQAGRKGVALLELKKQFLLLEPNGYLEKRYLELGMAIVIEHKKTMEELEAVTGLSCKKILNYLDMMVKDTAFFPSTIMGVLRQEVLEIVGDREQENKGAFERMVIELYRTGRYSYLELSEMLHCSQNQIYMLLTKRASELLTKEEYLELESHKKEIGHLMRMKPSHLHLVKDPRMIMIAKTEFCYVTVEDYSLLSFVVDFLNLYQRQNYNHLGETLLSLEMLLISDLQNLKRLLKEQVWLELEKTLFVEQLLRGNALQHKNDYIKNAVYTFVKEDFDLVSTSHLLEVTPATLIHTLGDPSIVLHYGVIVRQYIDEAIQQYFQENEKVLRIKRY